MGRLPERMRQAAAAGDEAPTATEVPVPAVIADDANVVDLHTRIVQKKMSAVEAIRAAKDLDKRSAFVTAYQIFALCQDVTHRLTKEHGLIHRAYGLAPDDHVGPAWLEATRISLGLSDQDAGNLIIWVRETDRIRAAMLGNVTIG